MDLLEKGSRGLSGPYSGVSSEAERGSGCFSALSTLPKSSEKEDLVRLEGVFRNWSGLASSPTVAACFGGGGCFGGECFGGECGM